MTTDEDPMHLPNAVLALIAEEEEAMRGVGLRPYTLTTALEAAVGAYRRAVASGEASAIQTAEDAANRRAAKTMEEIANATIRLLEGSARETQRENDRMIAQLPRWKRRRLGR